MNYSKYVSKMLENESTKKYVEYPIKPYTDFTGKKLQPYTQPPKCGCGKGKYSNYVRFDPKKRRDNDESAFAYSIAYYEQLREKIFNDIVGLLEDDLASSDFFKPLFQAAADPILPPPLAAEIPDMKTIEEDIKQIIPDFDAATTELLDEEKVYVESLNKNFANILKLVQEEGISESTALTFSSIASRSTAFEGETIDVAFTAYKAVDKKIGELLEKPSLTIDEKRELMDLMLVDSNKSYETYFGVPVQKTIKEFEARKSQLEQALLIPSDKYDEQIQEYAQLIIDHSIKRASAEIAQQDAKIITGRKGTKKLESRTDAAVQEYWSKIKNTKINGQELPYKKQIESKLDKYIRPPRYNKFK